jgi:hypothetical protein
MRVISAWISDALPKSFLWMQILDGCEGKLSIHVRQMKLLLSFMKTLA